MRVRSAAVGLMILGASVAGCGGGGGGGGSGGGSTTASVVTAISPISSGLNLAALDAAGYTWDTAFFNVNQIAGGTVDVIALPEVAPTNSSLIVAHSPMGRIDSFDNGVARGEASFVVEINSIAAIATTVVASSASPIAPGGGDVYLRQGNAWQRILDTSYAETVVAALGDDVYAFSGEAGGRPAIVSLMQSSTAAHFVSDIAVIGSFIPTAAIAFRNEVYVGLTENGLGGGQARVFRGSGAVWRPILNLGGSGQARVTAMLVVNNLSLIVSVANFDAATGVPSGGAVYHFDGERIETLMSFGGGEAPLALCEQDQTVFIGTSRGRLLYRDAAGRWVNDPTVPQGVLEIGALLAPNAAETMVGARMSDGAHVLRRIANSGGVPLPPAPAPTPTPTPTPTPQPTGLSYVADVKPLLASCRTCHVAGSQIAGSSDFVLAQASDAQDYATITRSSAPVLTDTANPANSLLIRMGANIGGAHPGGGPYLDATATATIEQWIRDGRRQ